MIGEALREAGVLVGVFGILEAELRGGEPPLPHWHVKIVVLCFSLLAVGIVIERMRDGD